VTIRTRVAFHIDFEAVAQDKNPAPGLRMKQLSLRHLSWESVSLDYTSRL
jgi:hypothetical protein